MPRQLHRDSDRGSITAELAVALPAVFMVLAITASAFGLQIERMKLVDVAATAARGLGRGEPESNVRQLIEKLDPLAALTIQDDADIVCANLKRAVKIIGLGLFELNERQCARKEGL